MVAAMEPNGLTALQHETMLFVQQYVDEHGYAPSYDDIAHGLRLKARSQAHHLVSRLCERGYLRRLPHRSRALSIVNRI